MAKKTRISVQEYKALRNTLQFSGYLHASKLARVLLESFVFNETPTAEWFVQEGIVTVGSFTKLRTRLIHDQFIHFREETKRYSPAARLLPYLQKIESNRSVSLGEFRALETLTHGKVGREELEDRLTEQNDRLNRHEAKLLLIAEAVNELQKAMEPPDSPVKKSARERSAAKIAALATAN